MSANVDPANIGRVQVRLAQISGPGHEGYEAWARIATLMAGNNRSTWFIPDVHDEVLVAFEGGDMKAPYVLGALWSGTDSPPGTMDANNTKKLLRSRSGVTITLDDQSGQQSFTVETPGGQKLTLKDGPGSIEITDTNGNSVKFEPGGVTVNASALQLGPLDGRSFRPMASAPSQRADARATRGLSPVNPARSARRHTGFTTHLQEMPQRRLIADNH